MSGQLEPQTRIRLYPANALVGQARRRAIKPGLAPLSTGKGEGLCFDGHGIARGKLRKASFDPWVGAVFGLGVDHVLMKIDVGLVVCHAGALSPGEDADLELGSVIVFECQLCRADRQDSLHIRGCLAPCDGGA